MLQSFHYAMRSLAFHCCDVAGVGLRAAHAGADTYTRTQPDADPHADRYGCAYADSHADARPPRSVSAA